MGVEKDNFIYEKCMDALDATFKKELEECSDKGVEISQECKTYFKKKFETTTSESKNNETEKNSERS